MDLGFVLGVILLLAVIGVGIYLVSMIPMDPTILQLIRIVLIIAAVVVVLWLIFGLLGVSPHLSPHSPTYR